MLVNFSATCGKEGNAAETIVEFPYALLWTGKSAPELSDETRLVIRPRTGQIDPQRLARIGVAQEEVDNGDTLTEAVQQVGLAALKAGQPHSGKRPLNDKYLVKRARRMVGVAQLEKTIEDRLVSADKSYAVVVVVRSASRRGRAMALSPD